MLLLEELGARAAIEERGFQLKYGASFIDEENNAATQTFYFLPGQPWPNYSYQVPRAEFDTVLLEHAKKRGVTVFQPATVEGTEFDAGGVSLTVSGEHGRFSVRAKMLVDATGATRSWPRVTPAHAHSQPRQGRALRALQSAARQSGLEEGNIRVYVFREGWFWWIPLAGDVTSVGAVCHARTVKQ